MDLGDTAPLEHATERSMAVRIAPVPLTWNSERYLDGLTFFLADVADGLGPFLVIDLTTRRDWSASQAGLAMSALLVGTIISQTFTGAWIDRTRYKRLAISVASLLVAIASLALYYASSLTAIVSLQLITGIAVTVFPPAIAAISLGIVGRRRLARRAGRNEPSSTQETLLQHC